MCEALATLATSLALAAAQSVASYMGQSSDAKAQLAYQEAQMRANNEAAVQNANNAIKEQNEQSAAERIKQMQEADAAARELQKNQAEFLQRKGQAIASSPDAGGASLDALLADYDRAYAMGNDVIQEQLEMQGVAADTNIKAYHDRAQTRIDSQSGYIPAPVSGSNALANALGFAGNAFGSYNAYTGYGKGSIFDKDGTNVNSSGNAGKQWKYRPWVNKFGVK